MLFWILVDCCWHSYHCLALYPIIHIIVFIQDLYLYSFHTDGGLWANLTCNIQLRAHATKSTTASWRGLCVHFRLFLRFIPAVPLLVLIATDEDCCRVVEMSGFHILIWTASVVTKGISINYCMIVLNTIHTCHLRKFELEHKSIPQNCYRNLDCNMSC